MAKVIDTRVRSFAAITDDAEIGDGPIGIISDKRVLLPVGYAQDVTFSVAAGTQAVLELAGRVFNGNVTVTGPGSVLITDGTVRGNVTIGDPSGGDQNPLDCVVQNVRIIEGVLRANVVGGAMFDALSVSRSQNSALTVGGRSILAHAIAVDNVWMPTDEDPADAIHLTATENVEVRQLQAHTISSFSRMLRVLVLDGAKVFAADVTITNASAPRGTVHGVVPTSEAPTGPVLGNISVQAHSGGEIAQMHLTDPDGGILVTQCEGDGVTRPVVADISRTHGAVAPHFSPSA